MMLTSTDLHGGLSVCRLLARTGGCKNHLDREVGREIYHLQYDVEAAS